MKRLINRIGIRRVRPAILALVLVWLVALGGVGIPAWLQVMRQHKEVDFLAVQLAELDRWNVAGKWLGRSLETRRDNVNESWNTLFPSQREREELFLDLALIADDSGVQDFELAEMERRDKGADESTDHHTDEQRDKIIAGGE